MFNIWMFFVTFISVLLFDVKFCRIYSVDIRLSVIHLIDSGKIWYLSKPYVGTKRGRKTCGLCFRASHLYYLLAQLLVTKRNLYSMVTSVSLVGFYHPQTKLQKGYVFTPVCQSFCPQGEWGSAQPGCRPVGRQTSLPPFGVQSTGGRYASYWNASLL